MLSSSHEKTHNTNGAMSPSGSTMKNWYILNNTKHIITRYVFIWYTPDVRGILDEDKIIPTHQ